MTDARAHDRERIAEANATKLDLEEKLAIANERIRELEAALQASADACYKFRDDFRAALLEAAKEMDNALPPRTR